VPERFGERGEVDRVPAPSSTSSDGQVWTELWGLTLVAADADGVFWATSEAALYKLTKHGRSALRVADFPRMPRSCGWSPCACWSWTSSAQARDPSARREQFRSGPAPALSNLHR
jgi:hypothetical protein